MVDKVIGELPGISSLDATSLFVAEQSGQAVKVSGKQLTDFSNVETNAQVEQAKASAQAAKTAQDAAEAAILKGPIIQNGTWWVYNQTAGAYQDTGIKATGPQGIPGPTSSVNGISPDASGNITLTASNVNAYSKTETNTLLQNKADASSVYTKTESDTLLAGKAPAGYGLGTTPKKITDWNDAKLDGWYCSDKGALNSPNSNMWFFGIVYNGDNPEVFVQEVWHFPNVDKVFHWQRFYYPGTGNGTPWEWIDPPLYETVEYRTTERYHGKPVYVMKSPSKTLGAAGSTVYIEGLPGDIEDVIDYRLQIKTSGGVVTMNNRFNSNGSAQCVSYVQVTTEHYARAVINCISDCTSLTATCTFKYIKTTD